jgi:3-hydroxybutyryl-CoA dehydrogenase
MHINILGFGIMAQQIGALLTSMGIDVTFWDVRDIHIDKLHKQIKIQSKFLEFGSHSPGKVTIAGSIEEIEDHLTIEAIVEELAAKKDVYRKLKTKITCDYFTNSSSISPLEIGENVNGLHFFNPLFKIKLIEVVNNSIKQDEAFKLIERLSVLGFQVVNVLNTRGYVANYVIFNEVSNVFKLIERHHYTPGEIGKVYAVLFNKDLFDMIDLVGVDTTYNILKNLKEHDDSIYLPKTLAGALEKNVLGKKNASSIKTYMEDLYK